MKKFFRFGKEKKGDTPEGSGSALSRSSTASAAGSGATSVDSVSGYVVKEKDLPKLHKACWAGDIGKVKQLAKKDVLSLDKDNRTALHLACAKGHSTIVKELLEWKAKVNVGDNDAKTPLMKAAECDHARCAQLLLENRADPNIKDRLGMSALHYAAQIGNDGMLLTLLEPEHTDIDIQNNNGQTPLHLTILENHFDAGKTLLEEGCNPDVADADGRTPLILAAQEGLPEFVKIILACEADTLAKDKKGWTADDIAIMNSHDDCKEIIQQYNMKNNIASPRSNVTVPSVAGAPASDEPVELSEASRLSEPAAAGGDSWADTDEDSDAPGARKASGISLMEEMDKRSKHSPVGSPASRNRPQSSSKKTPTASPKSQSPPPPGSPKTTVPTSARSASDKELSFRDVDDNWSDNESDSLFSSQQDKKGKVSLVKLANQKAPAPAMKPSPLSQSPPKDQLDSWGDDDDSLSFPMAGGNTKKNNVPKLPVSALAQEKNKKPTIADLDLSDVSDISDLNDGPKPVVGASASKDTLTGESEWDTTPSAQPAPATAGRAPPLSARSNYSNWDSSVVDDGEDLGDGIQEIVTKTETTTEVQPLDISDDDSDDDQDVKNPLSKPAQSVEKRPPLLMSQNVSSWGDSDDDDIPEIPKIPSKDAKEKDANAQAPKSNSPSQEDEANLLSPPTPFASTDDVTEMKEADDRWDSESDIPSTPKVPSQKISLPIKSNKVEQESLLDDDWDTSSEIESIEGAPNNFIGLSPQLQPKILKPSPLIDEKVFDKNTGAVSDVQPFNMTVEDDDWDSDIESKLDPSSGKSGLNEISKKDDANIDQPNSSRKSSNIVDIKQDDDNSKWDSESDIEESPIPSLNKSPAPSRQEHPKSSNSPPPAEKAAVTGGMMMGDDDDDDDDDETDDDEMEEESTWERENKLKKEKEAEKKRMEDEMKRIEEEKRHEEEHRKAEEKRQNEEKVKEEMRREEEKRQEEKREEERRKAEEKREEEQRKAEEKRQKEEMRREEEKRQEEKREEERRKAEEKREEERRKVEQKRAEEHRKAEEKRLEAERKKAEDAKHIQQQVEAKLDKSGEEIQKLRALSDEDEEHSSSLRRKREQLERELEEAKKAKVSFEVKGKPKTAGKMHDAWDDDDDDDTFNDLDVPGMESPRKVDVHVIGTASPVRTAVLDNLNSERRIVNRQLSDDCLSYSSTEHDVSDHVPTSHGTAGHVNLSIASDSVNVMRLQEQLREAQRKMDKERNTKTSLEIKKKNLEKEKADVIQKLEDVTRAKSNLEKSKIDLEAKIRNLQYQFNEETEKRKNAEVLYAKTKEQLARKEEQYSEEIDSKQKLELSMRNLQMELRGALSVQKQVEEEKADLLRELNHEKNARILQEQINEEQLHFQKTLNEDLNNTDPRDFDKQLADAISKLDGSDEKPLNTERLKAELYAVKMELERLRSRNKDDHELLATENEELHQKIEDLRADIKLNEEALTHASIKYNMDLTSLSTANQKLNSSLDNEISVREKSEAELISVTSRLESCLNELEKTTMARSELERTLQRDKEDWSRQLERRDQEIDHLKENNASLQQQVKDLDHKLSRTENELSIANATLVERTQQLTTIQKELEARRCSQDSLDADWRRESEEKARLQARVESQQEKISCLQHENVSLQQQLDEARVAGSGYGDQFNQLLANMRTDHEKGREQGDMEKFQLKNEIDKLASKLEDTKEKLIEANRKEKEARERAERVEQQQLISQQQAAGQAGEFNNLARSKQRYPGELEDKVHELELEKARMEAELRHQCQLVENLQRELQDANNEALATQTVASHEAEDAKALWETEVKSRSKLGLRMAQIERERTEAQSTNDEEKRKTRKAMELKKAAEIKYDNEHEKNIQLQKELLTLRKHLKVAKQRLKNNKLDHSEVEHIRAELEAKARVELNQKLEEVNAYLEEQARAREKLDRMRDDNESELRKEYDKTRRELLDEVQKLRESYQQSLSLQERNEAESNRLRQMYESELKLRERLVARLEKANDKAVKASAHIAKQRSSSPDHFIMNNGAVFGKSTVGHGLNDLSLKIRQELDKSIAKHLEKAPHVDISSPPRASNISRGSMSSPYNHSSSEYMSVLQRNYLL